MNENHLEPGLLPIFKLYVLMRLGVIVILVGFFATWRDFSVAPSLRPYAIMFLADAMFLVGFLSWPEPQRLLGRSYLPIGLIIVSCGPITEERYLVNLYGIEGMPGQWLIFPFLAIPLILTAWQYRFRHVLLFCLGTALFELVLVGGSSYLYQMDTLSGWSTIVTRSAFLILIGYIVTTLMNAQRRQRQQLAEANAKLVRYATTMEQLAVSRERNRLARELHDTLAHTLSGLAVQLDAIATVLDPLPPKADAMLERALDTTRSGLDETRRALQDLRAAPLEDLGLVLALSHLAENITARAGLALDLDLSVQISGLSPEVEQCYYRVAQEALDNVIQHAQARRVAVRLEQNEEALTLTIEDDGQGFAVAPQAAARQFGLVGMRERAALIGGSLEIEDHAGRGTTVRLHSGAGP